MGLLEHTIAAIPDLDASALRAARARMDSLTKPLGSLGRLESLAVSLAGMRGVPRPEFPRKTIFVTAGDHGVSEEGVSQYPAEVTVQMLHNFARGGAVINALARQAGAELIVVDMGVKGDPEIPNVLRRSLGPGTRNLRREPAMSRDVAVRALEIGIELVNDSDVIAIGDMGIGNTTSSTALICAFTGATPKEVTGHGTGIDAERRVHKIAVIEDALRTHAVSASDPIGALAALGGFEIAALAGITLGAAARRIPVVLDGLASGAAALVAAALAPRARGYWIAAHRSVEPSHSIALDRLGLEPLLDLQLRLGEASGAALVLPLLDTAARLLREVASFEEAEVSRAC